MTTEANAGAPAGEPVPPTPEFMVRARHRSNNPSLINIQVHSLMPGVVTMIPILNPDRPEGSRTEALALARRAGFALRTHKDSAGNYWMMRMDGDSTNE